MQYNQIEVVGNLTKDPEIHNVGETVVCNLSLAINRSTKNNKTKEIKKEVVFITVVAWGDLANECMNYSKGNPLFIIGRLTQETWNDNQGQQKSVYKIRANHILSVPKTEKISQEE